MAGSGPAAGMDLLPLSRHVRGIAKPAIATFAPGTTALARRARTVVILAISVHVLLITHIALESAPTYDEPAHLAAGISHWKLGTFALYRSNPPLVRSWAALPVLALRPKLNLHRYSEAPRVRAEMAVGRDFVAANGERSLQYVSAARVACLPFAVAGCLVTFLWATRLYGCAAGWIALGLWAASPNIIAHSGLMTPDLGATALGALACYAFWRWLREPSLARGCITGVLLGMAELAKMTWIILFVVWPVLWLAWRLKGTKDHLWRGVSRDEVPHSTLASMGLERRTPPSLAGLAAILVIGLFVLNAGYGFDGTFRRLAGYDFLSTTLTGGAGGLLAGGLDNRFTGTWIGSLPVPLPQDYIVGVDFTKHVFEERQPGYLGGSFERGGWWYYYLYALAVKVPLGTWLLVAVAFCLAIRRLWRGDYCARGDAADKAPAEYDRCEGAVRITESGKHCDHSDDRRLDWADSLVLLGPAFAVFIFVSANGGINEHLRYVLPVFPFAFIWISQVGRVFESRGSIRLKVLILASLAAMVAESLSVYPHSASFFNQLAGGPRNGWKHLNCSNIDWGQDLLNLSDWLGDRPRAVPLYLAYYGSCSPTVTGIAFQLPPKAPPGYAPSTAARMRLPTRVARSSRLLSDDGMLYGPVPGWHAVSVHLLCGSPARTWNGNGQTVNSSLYDYSYYQKFVPVATVGYSIYIYRISLAEANDVRRRMGLAELADSGR